MRSLIRVAVLGALAVSLFSLAGPVSPAGAARNLEVALQDEPVFLSQSYYERERALQQAKDMQVSYLRVNLQWNKVLSAGDSNNASQPSNPTYDWGPYDGLIDAAARYGIRVEFSVTGPAPRFASAQYSRYHGDYKPEPAAYARFARAAAEHFKGRVSRFMIWNEPNLGAWLQPYKSSGTHYRRLFQAAYAQIKAVDPSSEVLIGVTAPYELRKRGIAPLSFLRQVTRSSKDFRRKRGGGLRADGYAHHPYDFTRPIGSPKRTYPPRGCSSRSCPGGKDNVTLGTLSRLNTALRRLQRSRALRPARGSYLPVFLTEYGYYAKGKRRVSDSRRASYLRQAFQIAQKDPRVRQLLQYSFIQPPGDFPGSFFDLSILKKDGSETRPYRTLRSWASSAAQSAKVQRPGEPISLPPTPTP